jgi:hypothetical protein
MLKNTLTDNGQQGKKFRPQQFSLKFRLKHLPKTGSYNYVPYFKFTLKNYLHYLFSILHYRSSHAPDSIRKKWRHVAYRFEQKYKKIL